MIFRFRRFWRRMWKAGRRWDHSSTPWWGTETRTWSWRMAVPPLSSSSPWRTTTWSRAQWRWPARRAPPMVCTSLKLMSRFQLLEVSVFLRGAVLGSPGEDTECQSKSFCWFSSFFKILTKGKMLISYQKLLDWEKYQYKKQRSL